MDTGDVMDLFKKDFSKDVEDFCKGFGGVGIRPIPPSKDMSRSEKKRLIKYGDTQGLKSTPTLNDFIHIYTLSYVMALDKAEIGKEKVLEIMEQVYETSQCILEGYINIRDVETMCRDVYGIDFVADVRKRIYVNGNKLIKT